MNDSTEDLVEEREELMAFPSENSRLSSKKTHLLKPCFTSIDGSEAVLPRQNRSDLKALSFSVSFPGWRRASTNFKSWATKMAALHKHIWRKAGIFEAVMVSTYRIKNNTDLVLGIAEKWCPDTKTFVFPWGETTITLEDVMVLLGFSVLGLPVFATLNASGEKTMAKLKKEWLKIKKDNITFVTQLAWMRRFMDSNDELEHVAFLVCWLSYFVFPSRYYHLYEAILPVAVHLSIGTKIALAPAVLAHLYAELSLLKNHIKAFGESTITVKTYLTALFKLVQVWTWERIKELQPTPNPLLKGEPRLALWHEKQRKSNVRRILDNSKIDSFEWRPYTKSVRNWEFPQFYPEKSMFVPVGPNLDDEFISFARCIKVSELVGIDYVEHYFPNRVASQFGMLQDVPCLVNQNNLSQEEAWDQYNKPIDDLTLYIPSRFAIPCVTPMFCEWWRKKFQESQYSSEEKWVVESADISFVPSGSKMNRTREDGREKSKDLKDKRRKYMMQACYKRRKYMKQARENDESTMGRFQTQVPSDNDTEDDSLTIAQMLRHNKNKYSDVKNSGGDASEPLGKKSRLETYNKDSGPCQKLSSVRADGDEALPPPEIGQRNEETGEIGIKAGKNNENNSSDPPLGGNGGVVDIVVSPPETRQTCNDELGVYGSNVDMIDAGSEEPKCLLQEDGAIAEEKASSDEKLCSEAEKEDDSLIQKKLALEELALKADNNEPTSPQQLASGGTNGDETCKAYKSMVLSPSDESNIRIAEGDGTQGQDCLLHDDGLGSEEIMKSNEQLENFEKRNDDFGEDDVGNDTYEKSLHELEVLASSIEERINKVERNVAWLKERRAIKQRKIAEARLI